MMIVDRPCSTINNHFIHLDKNEVVPDFSMVLTALFVHLISTFSADHFSQTS